VFCGLCRGLLRRGWSGFFNQSMDFIGLLDVRVLDVSVSSWKTAV
jgi:hypothetical protein